MTNKINKIQLKKNFKAKNSFQHKINSCINEKDIVFADGPSGVGKTYASAGLALEYLVKRKVSRIIITRPVVSVNENIGFLPGTMNDKIDPYIRPIIDAFHDFIPPEQVISLIEENIIEIALLGFMRGRTFSDSFVILDEAQNTTKEQMKMFLTRFGTNVKGIIQGDVTQSDLPKQHSENGLRWAINILEDCPVTSVVTTNNNEVIRSDLVKELLKYID